GPARRIPETKGQLMYEWRHLRVKLRARAPLVARKWRGTAEPDPHPLFRITSGGVRSWEKL
ncbi:MAG TPA: DNA lyase, partial [Opitutaceae bacterium]